MKIYSDITKTIGRTPLVEMKKIGKDLPGRIVLKLEFFNPLSSVKDRIGLAMIEGAEEKGLLKPGMEIVEPTSGNTGISLAFVAAAKDYKLTVIMPETASEERRILMLLLGAELILTPAALGMKGAIAKARELQDKNPGKIWIPSQFENADNVRIHRETTAQEIWEDTEGRVDMIISGVGTAGTVMGVAEVIKLKKDSFRAVAVEPKESHVLSGGPPGPHKIQGLGAGFIPGNMDMRLVDEIEQVDFEESLKVAREVIKSEGIPVGISAGAAIAAGLRQAAKPENKGKMIVVIVPSSSERYLSTLLAEPERNKARSLPIATVDEDYLKRVK